MGLPKGQMGNSEVGHLNLGTGQEVLQDLPRIDRSISSGSFFKRPVLLELCARAKEDDQTLHLISLVGPGGVHANDRHLVAVAELAARQGVKRVRVHGLLDGRDTPPRSAIEFVPDLEKRLAAAHPDAKIATIGGRYFAMDRDKRWERTQKGYDAIVHGVADFHAASALAAVESGYARGENDEFITPTVDRRRGPWHGRRRRRRAALQLPRGSGPSAVPRARRRGLSTASTGSPPGRCPRASCTPR